MNMKTAEKISSNPSFHSGTERAAAFHWADKKRFDNSVSEDYRKRAKDVFDSIWTWAGQQVNEKTVKPFRSV